MTIILLAALIPPLFLMVKVYQMDKIESEPVGLLVSLFALGAVSCFPAGIIESVLGDQVLASVFDQSSIIYIALFNFLVVAGAEEGCKYIVLRFRTWNHPAFDYRFDGVVYAVATTLGFAALENILYVANGGLGVAVSRALLSIPGHCIFGIYMGYYYGLAKQASMAGNRAEEKSNKKKALLIPMLLHGFYDFCLSTGYGFMILVFFIFVIILDVKAYKHIKAMAASDTKL